MIESLRLPAEQLLEECLQKQRQGLVRLDPTVRTRGTILKRWHLRVNVDLSTIASRQ